MVVGGYLQKHTLSEILFYLMAGVTPRELVGDVHPVSTPKGLPDDVSGHVKWCLREKEENYHSPSFMTVKELEEVQRRYAAVLVPHARLQAIIEAMKALREFKCKSRLVFFFDS